MTTKLYCADDLNDGRATFWCGPGAVAIITGWPQSAIRKHLPRNKVGWIEDLEPAFEAAGWRVASSANDVSSTGLQRELDRPARDFPTLAQWSRRRARRDEVNLVLIGGATRLHWIVVTGNRMADVSNGPKPVGQSRQRRRRVRKVYRVHRVRRVARPAPHEKRGRRGPARPYRAGYVNDNNWFVPMFETFVSRDDADRLAGEACRACQRLGLYRPDFEGKLDTPVVIQRRRDGRFTRAAAFGNVCDGLRAVSEIEWYACPADAAFEECR